MNDFLKSMRFKILVIVLTVLFGFMIMAVYTGDSAPLLSQVITVVTEPFQRLSASISGSVSGFFDRYLDAEAIYEENALLREQNAKLRQDLVDYERIKHEYEQLQEISDVRKQHEDQEFVPASVIERDHSSPFYAFTIDKGTLDGVSLHDPVRTADGLVGYVVEARLSTARVMTLLDININVGASNSSTRDIGNVTGTVDLADEGLCRMEYLPRDSEIEPGHIIVTGGGALFPRDIVIGEVIQITTSSKGNSIEATIRPAADIKTVKDVFVITSFEGKGLQ